VLVDSLKRLFWGVLSFPNLFSKPCPQAPDIFTTSRADSGPTGRPCIQEAVYPGGRVSRRPCIQEACIQEAVYPGAVYPGAVYPGAVAGEAPKILTASGAG
jgi:hypothetical protein